MSIKLMTRVWESSIPSHLKYTLLALADFSSDMGKCYPSMATLARKCNKSVRQCQTDISDLEELHLVQRVFRQNTSNVFWLNIRPEKLYPPLPLEVVEGEEKNPFIEMFDLEEELSTGGEVRGEVRGEVGVKSTSPHFGENSAKKRDFYQQNQGFTRLSTGGEVGGEVGVKWTAPGGEVDCTPGVKSASPKPSHNHYLNNNSGYQKKDASYEAYVARRLFEEAGIDLYTTREQRSLTSWIQWLDYDRKRAALASRQQQPFATEQRAVEQKVVEIPPKPPTGGLASKGEPPVVDIAEVEIAKCLAILKSKQAPKPTKSEVDGIPPHRQSGY